MNFRLLKADEIDVRVGSVFEKGCTLLLYKDARVDMNILDETVGAMNWKCFYTRDNANCTILIYDKEKGEWVGKEDTGTESFSEKEKGLASDSFKRAGFKWGIGRELYTTPFLFAKVDTEFQGGKWKLTRESTKMVNALKVVHIKYTDTRDIQYVELSNGKGLKVSGGTASPMMTNEDFVRILHEGKNT